MECPPVSNRLKSRAKWIRMLAIQVLITLGLLLLVEGAASFRNAWRKVNLDARADLRPTAESIHTEYDPLLGWISRPGFY